MTTHHEMGFIMSNETNFSPFYVAVLERFVETEGLAKVNLQGLSLQQIADAIPAFQELGAQFQKAPVEVVRDIIALYVGTRTAKKQGGDQRVLRPASTRPMRPGFGPRMDGPSF